MKKYKTYKDSGIEWLGKIPKNWKFSKLKYQTTKIIDGAHFTPTYIDDEDGIPFLRVTDLHHSEINLENVKRIPLEEHNELIKRCEPKKGDLLLSKNGTIGLMKIIDWDWEFSVFVSLCLIKFEKTLLNSFFYYFFKSNVVERQIFESSQKTSVTNLHLEKIKELRITIPPLEEQTQITNYLNHKTAQLDTLIAKKEQLISLLQEERTAMINQAVTKGLDPNVPMKDSGIEWLGEIPENWEVKSLKYLIDKKIDNRGKTPRFGDDGRPMLEVKQIIDDKIYPSKKFYKFSKNEDLVGYLRDEVKEGDVLIATVGATAGKCCIVPSNSNFFIAQNVIGFRCNEETDSLFFYYMLESTYFKDSLLAINKSNTIDNLKVSVFINNKCIVPPIEYQKKTAKLISIKIDYINRSSQNLKKEIVLLKEYKTALISEVVTGKIDVREEVLAQ
jgi:type I restriction enzyme S subunit